MTALDRSLPVPRLLELEHVELASSPEHVWERVRHRDLARTPLLKVLEKMRPLPGHLGAQDLAFPIDTSMMYSSPESPGFVLLADDEPRELTAAAIVNPLGSTLPFVHFGGARGFEAFDERGHAKIGLGVYLEPWGKKDTRLQLELRVDATDEEAWRRFRAHYRRLSPRTHLFRRAVLGALTADLATPELLEAQRPLPGDELLPNAEQVTYGITVEAPPEAIWPWLIQMGARRAGFYSIDALDNRGAKSADRIIPDLQSLSVGDRIPATFEGEDGLEVLRLSRPRYLVLGALHDQHAKEQLPFHAPRPPRYWHVTWAFVLEPLDARTTRLHVRARAEFPTSGVLHATWMRPVHWLMETAQLRHLKQRAERSWAGSRYQVQSPAAFGR